ncbi:unnamed protein product [Camellia sinensis]
MASSLSSSFPSNLTLLIYNLSSFITVKLDGTNFIIWQSQLSNILQATNLLGYVDGSVTCPSSTIIDSTGSSIPNPEFLQWTMIDVHLLSCITSTLTPLIYASVLQFHHYYEDGI